MGPVEFREYNQTKDDWQVRRGVRSLHWQAFADKGQETVKKMGRART
jgi:hypothetical protein